MANPVLKYVKGEELLPAWFALVILLVMVTLPLPLLLQLNLNSNVASLFEKDHPSLLLEQSIRETFPEDDVLINVFSGDDLYTDENLKKFERLLESVEQHELVDRVLSVFSIDHIRGTEDGFEVDTLVSTDSTEGMSANDRLQRVISDRFAPDAVVASDGKTLALAVRPIHELDDPVSYQLSEDIRKMIESEGLGSYFRGITGHLALAAHVFKILIRDNLIFVPLGSLLGMLLLWWMFHRILPLVVTSLTTTAVAVPSVAMLPLLKQDFSMTTSMTAPLLTALTIALLVHLYNAVLLASQHGYTGKERYSKAVAEIEKPARYTAITTAIGLLSLTASTVPPLQNFGLSSAFGVGLLYLFVIYLVPAILGKWDHGEWKSTSAKSGMYWIDKMIRYVARIGIRKAGWVVIITVLLLSAGTPLIFRIVVETDTFTMFPEDHDFIISSNIFEDNIAGTIPVEIVFSGDGRDSLKQAKHLQTIKNFKDWTEELPEVDHAVAMTDMIEDLHWAFNQEKPEFRTLPENPKLISQYLFIYDGQDLYEMVNHEFDTTRVTLSLNVHGAKQIGLTIDKLKNYLQNNNNDLKWEITGVARLLTEMDQELIKSQYISGLVAFSMIFIFMIIFWRSLGDALICMVPNIAPVLIIFIGLALTGITLNAVTAAVTSLTIGVAVDDTIHIFQGFKSRISRGIDPVLALVRTYQSSGKAIVATTLILSSQFFVMLTSNFLPTSQFGFMTGIGLIAALLLDIFLLPAILILIYSKKQV